MNNKLTCRICGNNLKNIIYTVEEKLLGKFEKYYYFECSECGCLQIKDFPENISLYYTKDYCDLIDWTPQVQDKNFVYKFLRMCRNKYAVFKKGFIGRIMFYFFELSQLDVLSKASIHVDSTILDVGSGRGSLLYVLKEMRFNYLLGVDKFIESDISYENGLHIKKGELKDISSKWDLIMFNHSFEHMEDPINTLIEVERMLNENGTCIIRIPVVNSFAWEHYRENWVALDAPRHYYLHSIDSLSIAAEKAGLSIYKILFDSTDFQFWGSEQYIKNIPLIAEKSYKMNPSKSLFSKKTINKYKKQAKKLNKDQKGDQAAFYLKKRN